MPRGRAPAGADVGRLTTRQRPFPLVPHRHVVGAAFGERRSSHRGRGYEIAGSREYRPGDPVSSIDWAASGRLSAARDADEFVVRESYADEAPKVMLLLDRGPSMRIYEPPLPWLAKRRAALAAAEAVAVSAVAARSELGLAEAARIVAPGLLPPRRALDRLRRAAWDGGAADVAAGLAALARRRATLSPGSFVFVVSDFLQPLRLATWSKLRSLGWEVVPVVVQDPVWEQSFPALRSVTVPFALPGTDDVSLVRFTAGESALQRRANEDRLAGLASRFRSLGLEHVLLGSDDPAEVDRAFARWAERRRRAARTTA